MPILKRIWEWVSHGDTVWGILNIIFPTLGGTGAGIISWIQQLPIIWLFFAVLGGIAIGLFVSNEMSARRIQKRRQISKQLEGVEFYEERQSLSWFRDKIQSARSIWAAYLIGGSTNNSELVKSGNFRRLLLLHPDSEAVKAIQAMEAAVSSVGDLQGIIRKLTKDATSKNCDVKWCKDITYSLLTIGNPPHDTSMTPPDDMWVLVEAYVPGIEAEKRPSFLVERSEQQRLADRLLASFYKLWEHGEPPNQETSSS